MPFHSSQDFSITCVHNTLCSRSFVIFFFLIPWWFSSSEYFTLHRILELLLLSLSLPWNSSQQCRSVSQLKPNLQSVVAELEKIGKTVKTAVSNIQESTSRKLEAFYPITSIFLHPICIFILSFFIPFQSFPEVSTQIQTPFKNLHVHFPPHLII